MSNQTIQKARLLTCETNKAGKKWEFRKLVFIGVFWRQMFFCVCVVFFFVGFLLFFFFRNFFQTLTQYAMLLVVFVFLSNKPDFLQAMETQPQIRLSWSIQIVFPIWTCLINSTFNSLKASFSQASAVLYYSGGKLYVDVPAGPQKSDFL